MNRTVLKKGAPRFAINETAYIRASSTRGFIEPVFLVGVDFDPGRADYLYTWQNGNGPGSKQSPVQLYESEIITLCEALDIQISVLTRELSEQQVKLVRCSRSLHFTTASFSCQGQLQCYSGNRIR